MNAVQNCRSRGVGRNEERERKRCKTGEEGEQNWGTCVKANSLLRRERRLKLQGQQNVASLPQSPEVIR